ncbi:hypothetical protein [Pseudomonas sp. 1152_12]|uniref:hypothetical protein n=1 Tax=Pseudomonas sp. 1152_12 TaxID=2604455 RepID=UPI004064B30C
MAHGGQLAVLGNQGIMDVPFSMSSYTERLIRDQQAQNIEGQASGPTALITFDTAMVTNGN